jgi:ketosteroid isomerase-like protein/quercetin dioxygenase-like cupin family protein
MRRSILSLCAALLFATGCTSVNVEEERNALMQRDREFAQSARNVDQFVSFFATDARAYPPGMPIVSGTDAIRELISQMMAAPGFSLSWEPTRTEVSASGDVGVTTGSYTSSMAGVTEVGKYVTVWRKIDGAWMVTDDIFNADSVPVPVDQHAMVQPSSLVWGDPPPGLPAGGTVAVVSGDPSKAEPFVLRAQMPAGYTVPLHWHPTTENLTVLTGTVAIGMGEGTAPTDLPAGSLVVLPAEMRHTFAARTAATIQIHGIGPFGITYVNPADDPRRKKP